jgi:hypothetical protein
VSAMELCVRCPHPKHAHALPPASPMCSNCRVVKATKLSAQHGFMSKEEVKLQ